MEGSIVYTNTGFTSANGVLHTNHHTYAIYVCNFDNNINANIRLNGVYNILLPHTPNQSPYVYVKLPGDYTTVECLTANITLAMFAVG